MSNFYFDLSLKLPKGGASHFRGGAKMLRGGAKQSHGRCAPPLKIRPWFEWESCSIFYTTSASFLHMPHVCIFSVVSYHLVLHKATHIK
jgi:hypothetical protein